MPQLLVRNLEDSLVRRLKRRAAARGVSVEEEHRRILKDALEKKKSSKPTLAEFLLSHPAAPDLELEMGREKDRNEHREMRL